MAPHVDYEALRAQTMGAGSDEAVTVNTRALIDKVLARYSGEWTTLRELLQNAADASATKVIIRFQTLPSATVPVPHNSHDASRLKHVLSHHTLRSTTVENNGASFMATDWARLKKIAEGNPDETKIGAFGVGFYSVFADCEEPFVSSGNEALAFYWKGDSLFTKTLRLDNVQNANTTFVLPMRNSTLPIPSLLSLAQFLTSSLTFVGLEAIELWLDDWRILELDKITAPSTAVDMSQDLEKETRGGFMKVKSVTQNAAQLHARWLKVVEWNPKSASPGANAGQSSGSKAANSTHALRTFLSRLAPAPGNTAADKAASEESARQSLISEDLMGQAQDTVFLHVNKADIDTTVSKTFSNELERATKKPPPKTTTVSLLTVSYDEHMVSTSGQNAQNAKTAALFSSVLPSKGKVFIGFPTNQTTGLRAHISTPSVIPTVERESIDLNNQFIRAWNVELLRVAGILVRVAWNCEMANLKRKLSREMLASGRKDLNQNDITRILPEAIFLLKAFNFIESTPLSEVATLIEEAFWTCNKDMSIDILSSRGVLPSSSVRVSVDDLGFVERIPMLPAELAGFGLLKRLKEYGVITDITIADLKSELEQKALNSSQLQRFLEWIGNKARNKEIEDDVIHSLLSVAVANDEEDGAGRLVVLSNIKTYLNPSRIPADMPVPSHTVPFKFIKKMNALDLTALGWDDLQMVPWLRWLVLEIPDDLKPEKDLQASMSFARAVLPVISKQWEGLSASSKASVIELLAPRTVIPTKIGMKKPAESYFPSVNLFEDLPVISNLQSVKEKFLIALGVRKTIDIGVVFDRLMATSTAPGEQAPGKWSHVELIKYLSSIRDDIPSVDIKRLQATHICVAEGGSVKTPKRHHISELFEPDESLRRLKLPILQWPGTYIPTSPEGKFLTSLGLRAFPTYLELINIIAGSSRNKDIPLRNHAFKYLIDNYHRKGYDVFDHASVRVPYLPLQGQDTLAIPTSCFTNERVAMLGFSVLKEELHAHAAKFGVQANPPIQECIKRLLLSPPNSKRRARELFEYFAGRLNEITRQQSDTLNDSPFVPILSKSSKSGIESEKSEVFRLIAPRLCFLGNDEKYGTIFDYVDFGQEANAFLLRCGSKHEPTSLDLAKLLVKEPARIFTQLGILKYSELLRNLAESWSNLKKDRDLAGQMRKVKFLLAYRELPGQTENLMDDEHHQDVRTAELTSADKIIIIDDMITYNQFKAGLLTAPPEVVLENFYFELGASELASLVEEHHGVGALSRDQKIALQLKKLIEERARLYLYDVPPELIKNNANWVEKNLSVVLVESISLRKTLRGYNRVHKEFRSAAVSLTRGQYTLSVTAKFDMFEVSQVLVPLLLRRHKTQHTMMLEMILSTDLRKLQSRGYNVQRILRQQAAEAQVAEEARKRQLAQEAEEIKEAEARWNQQKAQGAAPVPGIEPMPGVFPDSPDRSTIPPSTDDELHNQAARGFFAGLGKRLGFEKKRNSAQQITAGEGNVGETGTSSQADLPPPYSLEDERKAGRQGSQTETVTAPHCLHQNLVNAIQASRAFNSSDITSQLAVNVVKETHSYCDTRPGQNHTHIGSTGSIPIFLAKTLISTFSPDFIQAFMGANSSSLSSFALVLLDCAEVYGMKRDSIHIFYDETGSTIGFNLNKALFFNYRYFQNLHLPDVRDGKKRGDALVYWFVVMAHELAHNLIADHSADHSYYTESLIIQYFAKISAKTSSQSLSQSQSQQTQQTQQPQQQQALLTLPPRTRGGREGGAPPASLLD